MNLFVEQDRPELTGSLHLFDEEFRLDTVFDGAVETYRYFAHPPVDDDSLRGSLWRAYGRVKGGIRIGFTRTELRTSAGCAHHAIESVRRGALEWEDTWRPALSGSPRSSWEGERIRPVVEVSDGFGPTVGLLEAWARFEP